MSNCQSLTPCPAKAWPSGQNLPSPTDFGSYARAVQELPMLTQAEENALTQRWHEHQDKQAAWRLVMAHLRLVVRVVRAHSGYGLPAADLAQEGTVGLMKAVRRFDPARGVRLGVYALQWIEAEVREYVVHNWRMVRLGSTAAMKKLFFGYRKTVATLRGWGEDRDVAPTAAAIAKAMDLTPDQVRHAEAFFRGQDVALTGPGVDGSDQDRDDLVHTIWGQSSTVTPEEAASDADFHSVRHQALEHVMTQLPARDRAIFRARRLSDPATGLVELGRQYEISAERVRQIEARAFETITAKLQPLAVDLG